MISVGVPILWVLMVFTFYDYRWYSHFLIIDDVHILW